METTEEIQKGNVLYYRDHEAETRTRSGTEAAARALNEVYAHFKFKEISEIPSDVQAWIIKRTLETNPQLAGLAKTHKLSSLNYEVPGWIRKAGEIFSGWHATKSSYTQNLQWVKQKDEVFIVDTEALKREFENNQTYRKYFDRPDQLKRLDQCKRFIQVLNETGIGYPGRYITIFKFTGNPWARVINDKYVPCLEYVLTGEIYPNAPMVRAPDYILESVLD